MKLLNLSPLIALAIGVFILNAKFGGGKQIIAGLKETGSLATRYLSLLLVLFLLAGQIYVFFASKPGLLERWLSGRSGTLLGFLAGAVMPGGLSAGPTLQRGWEQGMNKNAILMFIFAGLLVNWMTILTRIPILGWKISCISWGIGTIIAICLLVVFLGFQAR